MAIAYEGEAVASLIADGGTTMAVDSAISIPAGTLVVADVLSFIAAIDSFADDQGNTWVASAQIQNTNGVTDFKSRRFYSILTNPIPAGSSGTFTVTFSGFTDFQTRGMKVLAYSGVDTLAPLDEALNAKDEAFPQSQPSLSGITATAGGLIVCTVIASNADPNAYTASAGATKRGTDLVGANWHIWTEDRIGVSAGDYTLAPTLTTAEYWTAFGYAFKAAAEAPKPIPNVVMGPRLA